MKTDKFIGLILDIKIDYEINEQENTIEVFPSSNMAHNYTFVHDDRLETVKFAHSVHKRGSTLRFGTETGKRFLHNLEFAPHRITGKRKEV